MVQQICKNNEKTRFTRRIVYVDDIIVIEDDTEETDSQENLGYRI